MLRKRNLLENVTAFSCCGSVICFLVNYVTVISPIKGIWFLIYILLVFLLSILFSFKFLRWLLHLNKPIKYELEGLAREYPCLSFLASVIPKLPKHVSKENKDYDTNELSIITTVLERKLVSSWYVPYISEEIGFPFACKQMLDQMISRVFQISSNIETKDVYVDACVILTTHLNKYKKALKLHEKAPTNTVESFYKKSHPVSDITKTLNSADHCSNLLRIVIKDLVAWELCDTPQSELLVRVLSKKMDNFIESTLSNPNWLNDRLMLILSEKCKENTEKKMDSEQNDIESNIKAKVSNYDDTVDSKVIDNGVKIESINVAPIETSQSSIETSSVTPTLELFSNEELVQSAEEPSETLEGFSNDSFKGSSSEPVEIKATNLPILRQRRGRQGRNEVKIYDRIIEGSMKTWDTDMDLQCISVGQDLLAQLDGEMTLSRLWGQDTDETSPNPPKMEPTLWFGEDEIDMELEAASAKSHPSPRKEVSPKPADALLKDIQSTVNQAKTKIGDLQVSCPIDVPCKQISGDEAAGMMEGLLDFGIAGLRKGLRFTGLGDDSQDKSLIMPFKEKHSPPEKSKIIEISDVAVAQKELNGNSVPHLVKQNRVLSQESVGKVPPPLLIPPPLSESPEPEYEEAADLSTSIAKLRCLLQQRDHEKAAAEEIWWESAEETRGRTNYQHSNRPIDTATLADEFDLNSERNTSPSHTSNNMQRLDKLFTRTVTGVFNTIKTAVGAEGEELPKTLTDWSYVSTSMELSICGSVVRLLGSRRALTHVDAALDSLEHLHVNAPQPHIVPDDYVIAPLGSLPRTCNAVQHTIKYLQHMLSPTRVSPKPEASSGCDDHHKTNRMLPNQAYLYSLTRGLRLQEWCSVFGRSFSACCGFISCLGLCRSHVANRILTLLFADITEDLINIWLDSFTSWLKTQIFSTFEQMSKEDVNKKVEKDVKLREFDVKKTSKAVMDKLSGLKYLFGEEALSDAVELVITSFTNKEINRDVIYRVLDLTVLHFKESAGIRNPSFDVN